MSSPEREYWIAGARDELKSLEDLDVFVLVPRSDVPRGQRPLFPLRPCVHSRALSSSRPHFVNLHFSFSLANMCIFLCPYL